jgi:hypothetical protein
MGVHSLHAAQPLLASAQGMSGLCKVPPERLARSSGMTSVDKSVSVQLQIKPLLTTSRPLTEGLLHHLGFRLVGGCLLIVQSLCGAGIRGRRWDIGSSGGGIGRLR